MMQYLSLFFLSLCLVACEKESDELAEVEKMVLLEEDSADHGPDWSTSEGSMITQETPFIEEVPEVEEVR